MIIRKLKQYSTIIVDDQLAEKIDGYLSNEPETEEECFGEEETFSFSTDFDDGYTMDIKVCGVKFDPESTSNKPWTEGILFDEKGRAVRLTDPADDLIGRWELESDTGVKHIANVWSHSEYLESWGPMKDNGVQFYYAKVVSGKTIELIQNKESDTKFWMIFIDGIVATTQTGSIEFQVLGSKDLLTAMQMAEKEIDEKSIQFVM